MEGQHTAFAGDRLLARGDLAVMVAAVKDAVDGGCENVLVFDDDTGRQVDLDVRGTLADALARALPEQPKPGPGRPKLGVVSREISLLPRHWEWLEGQPQGASAALRRLVDDARKREPDTRRRRDAAGRFMWTMAGDLPRFEDATRALYAGDRGTLEALVACWPADVRDHVLRLAP